MAGRRTEHSTAASGCAVAVEKEDVSGLAAARPPASGCATLAIGHVLRPCLVMLWLLKKQL